MYILHSVFTLSFYLYSDIFHVFDDCLVFNSVNVIWHQCSPFFVVIHIPQCVRGAKGGIVLRNVGPFTDSRVISLQGGVVIFTRDLKTSCCCCCISSCYSWVLAEMLVPLFLYLRNVFCFFFKLSLNLELFLLQYFLILIQNQLPAKSANRDQRQKLLALPMETQADHVSQEPQALLESGKE